MHLSAFPAFTFRVQEKNGKSTIFCFLRKKWVALTPEEWVRQHMARWLVEHQQYPPSMIRTEGGLQLHQTQKRSDLLVYAPTGEPFLLVECKAPQIKISQNTLNQALRYNAVLDAKFIVLTNGLGIFVFAKANNSLTKITNFPTYER